LYCVGSVRSESVVTGMPEDEAFIQNLPTELLEYILGLVSPYSDLQSCKLVCKNVVFDCCSSSLQSRFLLKHYMVNKHQIRFHSSLIENNIHWETLPSTQDLFATISRRYSYHAACSACYYGIVSLCKKK
jgi:hypothetical protein